MSMNPRIDAQIEREILALNTRYAHCLDDERLEEWPQLFTEDCRYVIHPRENLKAGLEGYWLYFDSNAMLRDRVVSLREANLYNIHQNRHLVSNVVVEGQEGDAWRCRASYLVVQTDVDGNARVFSVGEYRDLVVLTPEGPRFKERLVVPDSYNVQGMIAFPL